MSADASESLSQTLVLNALRDLHGDVDVLADADSRATVEAAFEEALHVAERDKFERTLDELEPGEDPDEETSRFLTQVASDVLDELVADDVHVTLIHDAALRVPAREAALYTFMTARDPDALDALDLPEEAADLVDEGATALVAGEYATAQERFDAAIDAVEPGTGDVSTRVLAGFAAHLDGEDATAMDYVEETLHLETRAWSAKLVGYAADHRRPQKFREGKLGARVFFRWSTEIPDRADVTVSVGSDRDSTEPLPGSEKCMPFERLWPETTVRVELAGELSGLPTVETYYVATGVVDLEVFETRTVENVLLSGPETAEATEQLRFERE